MNGNEGIWMNMKAYEAAEANGSIWRHTKGNEGRWR